MRVLGELKRRNVFKVGAAYLVLAWLLVQIGVSIEGPLRLPDWFDTVIIVLLAIGFPVSLIIAWAFELTPEGVRLESTVAPAQSSRVEIGQRLNYLITGALALAVIFLLVDKFALNGVEGPAGPAEAANAGPSTAVAPAEASVIAGSIAILPFDTLTNDAQNVDFAEGVYADIFYELEKLDRLTVIGRRTMKRYENTLMSYQEIAAETSAQAVLELLVRFADNRVRINAELVRVVGSGNDVIWTEAYEEDYTSRNFFDIQTDIARNIAQRLVGALSPAEEARLTEVLTEDAEALAYYLRALPYIDDGTEENADNCLEPVTRAVELDPGFKEAWFRKAVCHDIRGAVYPNLSAEEQPLAIAALERALAIDDEYADAQAYLAAALSSGGNWREAGRAYRRALDLGIDAHLGATAFAFSIGHLNEALEGAHTYYARDPDGMGGIGINTLMLVSESAGDTERSDRMFGVGRALYEPWPAGQHGRLVVLMGRARQGQIDATEVTRYFWDAHSTPPTGPWMSQIREQFGSGDVTADFLRTSIAQHRGNPFALIDIATHAAYVGEPELAFEAMRNALAFFAVNTSFFWTPLFREVRQLDEFKQYMREIGMVDVWAEVGWPDLCEPIGGNDFRCD